MPVTRALRRLGVAELVCFEREFGKIMPVLHSHSLAMLRMAYEATVRAENAASAAADGTADDALVAIILSASAAEGYINDLPGMIRWAADVPGVGSSGDLNRLNAIAVALEFMEDERSPTRAKYLAVAALTMSDHIKTGREPFQSFDDLIALRNGIMHVKPVNPDEVNRQVKVANSLAQRGIARPPVPTMANAVFSGTWWSQIRTPKVAGWACESARQVMLALCESFATVGDVASMVKRGTITLREVGTANLGKNAAL